MLPWLPTESLVVIGIVQALAVGLVAHFLHQDLHESRQIDPVLHWLRDSSLAIPLSILAVWIATGAAQRLIRWSGLEGRFAAGVARALVCACTYALAAIPGNYAHGRLFVAEHHEHASFLTHATRDSGAVLLAAFVTLLVVTLGPSVSWRALWHNLLESPGYRRALGTAAVAAAAVGAIALWGGAILPHASTTEAIVPTGCAVTRYYDVVAVNVDIPFNRWGEHNPHGEMYVLRQDKKAVENWYVPLGRDASGNLDPALDPAGAANRRLRPRPLVLRANEGDCVDVQFTNELGATPGAGVAQNPRASIHILGASYDVQTSDGSHAGWNEDTTVGIGESITYHWMAPAQEGTYFFRDYGDIAGSEADGGSNAHGLYGVLAVEPPGSIWLDPQSGNRLYEQTGNQSGELYIDAIIVPPAAQGAQHNGSIPDLHAPNQVAFRESIQISQDEVPNVGLGFNYGIEPLFSRSKPINRCPDCVSEETWLSSWPYGDPALVKLASGKGPWYPNWNPLFATEPSASGVAPEDCGLQDIDPTGHTATTPVDVAPWAGCWTSNVTHAYPADPMKIRFVHAGPKETHVFHLHAHQWLADPFDVGNAGSTPGQPGAPPNDPANVNARRPEAPTIDSQTFGPGEGFTADLLFGAGSKPRTVGDSIFHCHLYPHFAEGFWSLFRVHDVLEDGAGTTPDYIKVRPVGVLPDRAAAGDVPPPPSEFNPGFPRFIPGTEGWRAPQPLNGISEPESPGAQDVAGTLAREDLQPASRIVAGKALEEGILEAVQEISNDASDGTFNLTFDGETTGPIAFNAPPGEIESALESLPSIDAVSVTGSGTTADPWLVKLVLWSRASSLLLSANDSFTTGATTISPSRPDLGDGGIADMAYKLALERQVSLSRYNPGYDPNAPPADVKLPKPGAPLVDPCPQGAREITYNVSILQLDVVYNEGGWHDPQARILVQDKDVDAVLSGQLPPEPLFFRANAGDCINFNLTNRLPNWVGNDDFLVLNQTNMVGQHIHLVKFDVTASDGSSNGWNNQQAAFSQQQSEFDAAILAGTQSCGPDLFSGDVVIADGCRIPTPPTFNPAWACASIATCPSGQTIHERWYADYELRTVFTHDHHFPAVDQNRGYFGGLIVEPKGMDVRNSFSGEWLPPINDASHGPVCGSACEAFAVGTHRDIIGPSLNDDFREFGLAIHDFVSLYRPCPPGGACSSQIPGQEPLAPPALPEEYPDADPGIFGINYRNAPFALRDTKNGVPVDPAYRFSSTVFGDPQTPLLNAYAGDPIRVRLIMGAQEEQHVVQVHGMRWHDQPDDPESPFVNSHALGVSDAINMEIPEMRCAARQICVGDYLYSGASTDDMWLGAWGILRVFGRGTSSLLSLPDNIPQTEAGITPANVAGIVPPRSEDTGDPCPAEAPVRSFQVISLDAPMTYNEFGDGDPYGLMYAAVQDGETPEDAIARARLDPEPMVLRANEGDCIHVTLTNMIDPNGAFALQHAPFGAADGDAPLVLEPPQGTPAGLRVGLHPSLLEYDVRGSDGATIGLNADQTVGPGESILYRWYAPDVTPGELGAINLTDYGDIRGHRHHGLFAGINIEPHGARYYDPYTGQEILSGTQADIRVSGQDDYREMTLFFQDGLNLRDAAGVPLPDRLDHPPTAEEPAGAPADAEDRGEKGFNYHNAAIHRRLGRLPGDFLDDVDGAAMADVFSSLAHGDPLTPIFRAYSNDAVRMRILQGGDKPRQHSFHVSGHSWYRQPFDDPAETEMVGASGGFSVGRALNLLFRAGGAAQGTGDHRFNCAVNYSHQSGGLWGLMRVYAPPAAAPAFEPDQLRSGTTAADADNPHSPVYHPLMPLELVEVSAVVYDDADADATHSSSEPAVEGVQVQIHSRGVPAPFATSTTNVAGRASFQVPPGAYDVKIILPPDISKPSGSDWAQTTPDPAEVDVPAGPSLVSTEIGMVRLGDVAVQVFDDRDLDRAFEPAGLPPEAGLAGWTVQVTNGAGTLSGTTDAGGVAIIDGLKPGQHSIIALASPGWLPTRKLPAMITMTEDANLQQEIGYAWIDANRDGEVTILDAVLVVQCVAFPWVACPAGGDVDGDGQANIRDALVIAQFVAGLMP